MGEFLTGSAVVPQHWPIGAQAHIGNTSSAGDTLPLLVVRVWPNEFGEGKSGVNGQVFLDGNDTFWVTSISETESLTGHSTTPKQGRWNWIK